jgi:nitrogen-specific signal transduction histidine kinase
LSIESDRRSDVAARAAHEINNALAGIQYAFLLIKDAVSPAHPNYSSVAAIERGIARIAAASRQLHETHPPQKDA